MTRTAHQGFTLIELSIVLVIIGLIVGGILVGRSLIEAATVRAQITQIEKYQTAAVTFREKYGYLPGDIIPQAVTQFGFTGVPTRAGTTGLGDGNGELDGVYGTSPFAWDEGGETAWFWTDLSTNSNLIEGGFNGVLTSNDADCASNSACSAFFPSAKIGNGAFVYVYSGYAAGCCSAHTGIGANFFGLSVINSISLGSAGAGSIPPDPALTVNQASAIDNKIDDGLPTTGNVLAQYLTSQPHWSTSGSTPSASTCFDTSRGTAAYSIEYQNGNNVNCGISFRMQAGD